MIFANSSAAERAVGSIAALCLGAAVALAILMLLPLAPAYLALATLAGGVAAGSAGFALVESGAPRGFAMPTFQPAAFEDDFEDDEVLLLDEVVAAIDCEPRLTSSFVPAPAEMVVRIDQFLDSGAGVSRRSEPRDTVRPDASAALHAALAEIRHSLRQG